MSITFSYDDSYIAFVVYYPFIVVKVLASDGSIISQYNDGGTYSESTNWQGLVLDIRGNMIIA